MHESDTEFFNRMSGRSGINSDIRPLPPKLPHNERTTLTETIIAFTLFCTATIILLAYFAAFTA